MKIIAIAATDLNGAIGYKNKLLFKDKADMQHFAKTTKGHTVLMGRKTFESIGKPLKGRRNIVLSKNQNFAPSGVEVFTDLQTACKSFGENETIYIIGGAEIYAQTVPLWNEVILTVFNKKAEKADAYFPAWFNNDWDILNKKTNCHHFIKKQYHAPR